MDNEDIKSDESSEKEAESLAGEQVELMRVSMNGEEFLIPVQEVSEILRPVSITPVPMAPDHMLGVANVHGQVICIVDPGKVLHLKQKPAPLNEMTRYLILRHPRMHLAIWVDAVTELFRVAKNALPEPDQESRNYLRGEMDIEGNSFKLFSTQVLFE